MRKKWTQKCLRYLKQWVLRCPPKKRKREVYDSPYSLANVSKFQKRDKF